MWFLVQRGLLGRLGLKCIDQLLFFSTNGTQVDGTKVKQRKAELHHGDEIHIVFKKNSPNSSEYVF